MPVVDVDPDELRYLTGHDEKDDDELKSDLFALGLETFDTVGTDPDAILDEWREYAATLGRQVRIDTPNGEVVGEAVDIEYPGSLVVETDDERITVSAGDCDHLRPIR